MVTVCFILLNTCNLIVCAQILSIYSISKYLGKETRLDFHVMPVSHVPTENIKQVSFY